MPDSYTTFGNFLLLKQRCKDALGTLWRAGEMERTGFKRIVWLRRLDQVAVDRAAFISDAPVANELAQVLKATNVVRNPVYAVEGGFGFTAWDYVPAQPLDQLLARAAREQFPIAIDNALLIVEKLAAALAAALAVEVRGEPLVHGFLVPHLILVGNDGEATVAGFGITRALRVGLERAGVRPTVAPYLAPEVLAREPASRSSDVYSLGAILYQLLTGTPLPVDPSARTEVLAAPQLAFEEGPVPQDVLAILRAALQPKPEDRQASAAEFKRDLEKLLYGGAYSPTTFNLALFMDRLYRGEIEEEERELQHERALDVTEYVQAAKPPSEEAATTASPPSSRTVLYAIIGGAAVLLGVIAYLLVSRGPSQTALDKNAQAKMVREMVTQQLAEEMKKLKQQQDELDAQKAQVAQEKDQLAKAQQAAASGVKKISPEEQQRLAEKQKEIAAKEAEQQRKETELAQKRQAAEAKLRAEEAAAATKLAAVQPTQAPTPAPALPTPTHAVTAPPAVPTAAPAAAPAPAATAVPSPTAAAQAPGGAGLGAAVREGDFVDFTQVDVPPQQLVTAKVVLPRTALESLTAVSGVVILQALVNEKGAVEQVRVLRGFPASRLGVDEACEEALKGYRYKPAMKNGVRVKTWTTVTFRVALTRGR